MSESKRTIDVLRSINFGERVAEDEGDALASYFVETDEWRRLYSGDVDIVYGNKGAGKSALYYLLASREYDLIDKDVLLTVAENPRGAAAFSNLVTDPPATEREFVALWKLYLASLICGVLEDYGIVNDNYTQLRDALEAEGLFPKSRSLSNILKGVVDYVKLIFRPKAMEAGIDLDPMSGLPKGFTGRIVFREPSAQESAKGILSVDRLLELANETLESANGFKVWVLLDRLDVAFEESSDLEKNALRALFRVYLDIRRMARLSLKIFLRTDIWNRITDEGFREASHITRTITLSWNSASLMNLVLRRALHNDAFRKHYDVDPEKVLSSQELQNDLFYRMCPSQVDAGERQSKTMDWILARTSDGKRENAPRELVHYLNELRTVQIKRLELGQDELNDEQLFARAAFKEALPEVSRVRLFQTLYPEYPHLKDLLEGLRGGKTQYTIANLSERWGTDEEQTQALADELTRVGFFEPRGKELWVPFLYRDGLQLSQGRAEIQN